MVPDGWLIKRSLLTFDFFPTSDICWVYGKNTKQYVNFISAGTQHGLVARLRSGRALNESYRQKTRDERLRMLRGIAPWAMFGYSEQIGEAWRNDRAAFAAEVDRRRRLLLAGASGGRQLEFIVRIPVCEASRLRLT